MIRGTNIPRQAMQFKIKGPYRARILTQHLPGFRLGVVGTPVSSQMIQHQKDRGPAVVSDDEMIAQTIPSTGG
jgi:hypothetical protein